MGERVQVFDHIIVGAGSAGCVMAERLSRDPANRVLLLEAGGRDSNPFIHIPGGLPHLVEDPRADWAYYTEPEPELMHRSLYWPRGRVLGGSSSINAMIYMRGHPQDYDDWQVPGWAWSDLFPRFIRSEDQARGADALHGVGGSLTVSDLRTVNPLSEAFVDAGAACGLARKRDFNDGDPRGVGLYQVTQRNGRRCSAAVAYLRPAMARSNLTVRTGALGARLRYAGGRVVGVDYRSGRREMSAHADREVVLCGGAINSPQLLMLSGVGPADHLREQGIRVKVDLPAVGENLQDHLDACVLVRCDQPVTLDVNLWDEALYGLRFLVTRDGPASSNGAEAGGFVESRHGSRERPDIQFHFLPLLLDDHSRNDLGCRGYTVHACNLKPQSRGRISLHSADPAQHPRIEARYLSEPRDMEVMVDAVERAREILAQAPFDPYREGEIFPGEDLVSTADIEGFIRRKAETVYHPAGTCRMGVDEDSVVDPQLRVRGVDGLRVVDASVMPTLIAGNTNAPVIAMAERLADMMLGEGA